MNPLSLWPNEDKPEFKLINLARQHYRAQEYEKALELFKESATLGYAIAQFFTGQMYDEAEGTPQDYEQAVYWYTKAAGNGDASAMWRLGTMYRDGEGVPVNNEQSAFWFKRARAKKRGQDCS